MKKEAKYIATVSLGVMGAGFLATLPFEASTVQSLLQGGFEAGVVGGLADWFAVSALFRHPLGIPIPHTALLPNNRGKITKALVSTVENELLSKETIRARLQQVRFLERGIELAEQNLHHEALHKGMVYVCKQAIQAVDLEKLAPLLTEEISRAVKDLDTSSLLHKVMKHVTDHGYEGKAFSFLLDKVDVWAAKEETRLQLGGLALKALEGLQGNGFMQFAVNAFIGMLNEDKVGGILQNFILSYTEELRTEGHPRREALLEVVRSELQKLEQNLQLLAELESWKEQLPGLLSLEEKIAQLLGRLRDRAEMFVEQPEFIPQFVIPTISKLIASVKNNPELIQQGEEWIQRQIIGYVEQNHGKIGQLVKENLDKLDNAKLIEMMEDKIGPDLQWIRVNGAICGFFIGVALAALKMIV
ncbi:DUF445 domain-containing protein [Paenibacillus eucommiae]|uniref:Uncharacterized membrane-anchored protein YjiN (DUF445 family) n=1 Tax=Paenibacillus eucommiae TaxID=1355755 RepID=A0ABS4J700_9BACL|nr:DUF445 domain-containing protein [Paenibacillus eucommiae]MBP1995026.1 uncharacterized membrane-anchored protein YjiN (DUF445 family) [Paenibacillus eucommiae]